MSQLFKLTTILLLYINIFLTITQSQRKYLLNTLIWPCVNVLGHVSEYII
jgi:hypothetical protein